MNYVSTLVILVMSFMLCNSADADFGCAASDEFESHDFHGEVYGDHGFEAMLGIRQLILEPTGYGWRIRVFSSSGLELPVRGVPSGIAQPHPSLISGAHYLNAENTATVQGPVQRKFFFGRNAVDPVSNPELIVPCGLPEAIVNAPAVAPIEGDHGIGELIIEDIGLADVGHGRTARLTYTKFRGCLGWHKGLLGPGWRGGADPGVPDITVSAMRHCGFDTHIYKLSDRMTKGSEGGSSAYLEPDLMQDGVPDLVAPATRISDGSYGLAICLRGDNRLKMAGFDENDDVTEVTAGAEFWKIDKGPFKPRGDSPKPAGDGLVMGIDRGPSVLIYMDADENIRTHRQGE